jgi:hypothetical protein
MAAQFSEFHTWWVSSPPLILIDEALDDLAKSITLREPSGVASHTAIVAEGLDSPNVAKALGRLSCWAPLSKAPAG